MNNKTKTPSLQDKRLSLAYFFKSGYRKLHRIQIRSNFKYYPSSQFNKCKRNDSYNKNHFSKSVKQELIKKKIRDIYNSKIFIKSLKNQPEIQQKLNFLLNVLLETQLMEIKS